MKSSPARQAAQRCESIKGLVRDGQFARAIEELRSLSARTEPEVADHAAWATARLPLVERERETVRGQRPEVWKAARESMQEHDYDQASETLGDFPGELRTAKMQQLFEEATDLADEVSLLEADMEDAERRGRHDARVLASLKRLQELKPDDSRVRQVRRQLIRRRSRGPISRLLGRRTPKLLRALPGWVDWVATAALLFAIVSWGISGLSRLTARLQDLADGTSGSAGAEGGEREGGATGAQTPGFGAAVVPPAQRRYVNVRASAGGDGLSWKTAWTDLQQALAAARRSNSGIEEIWVARGRYFAAQGADQQRVSFELVSGVDIYGSFRGGETSRQGRNPSANPTVLFGDVRSDDRGPVGYRDDRTYVDNSWNIVTADALAEPVILDGLTFRNGVARGPDRAPVSTRGHGGALRINASDLLVRNCRFEENYSEADGGAVVTHNGTQRFEDCVFEGNFARETGGAVYCRAQRSRDSLVFVGCLFRNNTGLLGGGAVLCDDQVRLQLANCRFIDNQTTTGTSELGNREGGGAVLMRGGDVTVSSCLFTGNNTVRHGGAFNASAGARLRVAQSTFSGNRAGRGVGSDFSLSETSRLVATGCILWSNAGSSCERLGAAEITVRYSCIEGGYAGPNNISADPQFTAAGSFTLAVSSPCVDAVPDSELPPDAPDADADGDRTEATPLDLAGRPRKQSRQVDMGAYESTSARAAAIARGTGVF